jgi:ketosteroid isomerase-like protein
MTRSGAGMCRACWHSLLPTSNGARPRATPTSLNGKAWIGGDAIVQNLFMRLGSEWDGFTITPKEFHDAGDTVVAECRMSGVHKATGKSMDVQTCHVWKLSDGKVKSFQQYVDTARMQDAMGTADAGMAGPASVA